MAPPSAPPSALVALAPGRSSAPPPPSAPAPPRPHQVAGGPPHGNHRGRRRRGGRGQGGSHGVQAGGSPGGAPSNPQWPSFLNPWTGSIHMWPGGQRGPAPRPGPVPSPQQALLAGAPPAYYTPPGPAYPAPQQASSPAWAPWTPDALTPPQSSSDWVIDSGASSHIASTSGMVTTTSSSSFPSSIVVGNGATLPVVGTGYSILPGPFRLNNVLIAPDMIKNLLSVRKFTTDNSVSVEFDPLGVSVKDLRTRNTLLRCDSSGPLYTLQLPSSPSGPCALVATPSSTTWHRCLGHPGKATL